MGLPALSTRVQPEGTTLVNFDTIFWTDPQPVSLTLTILGQAVDVVATPTRYHWAFGDGARLSTETPGAPYPSTLVTYRYRDARVTVQAHVETEYSARFRVAGAAWEDIDGTVTTVGPGTALQIAEGTPLLTSPRRG